MANRNQRNWGTSSGAGRGSQSRGRGYYGSQEEQGGRSMGRSQGSSQRERAYDEDDERWGSYSSRRYMTDPRDEGEFRRGYQGSGYGRGSQDFSDEDFGTENWSDREFGNYGNEDFESGSRGYSSRDRDYQEEDEGFSGGGSGFRRGQSEEGDWMPQRQGREYYGWQGPHEGRANRPSRGTRNRR